MKNMIKPPPSPIHAEGESLSEWFCPLGTATPSECSSLSIPFADLAISYMDENSSETSSHRNLHDDIYDVENDGLSQTAGNSVQGKYIFFLMLCLRILI